MRNYEELVARLRSQARLERYYHTTGKTSDEAADAIEELQQNIEQCKLYLQDAINDLRSAHEKEQKWIPVAERLPEKTGSYLVWMLYSHDETPAHSIINYDSDCEAFGEWDDYYDSVSLGWVGSDFIKIENVYAWMPLPEPPKEERAND